MILSTILKKTVFNANEKKPGTMIKWAFSHLKKLK